ncbi:MAG: hydrolase [Candidatus Neomarinimicrobiota bacterium]|nr:MAG: hydrolase [Candidatus Neomarinimicrobiota bacterium]
MPRRPRTIAVDFDGTIVENKFPDIGREKLFAIEALKTLQKKNFRIILWTVRHGKKLEEAVEFCRERGLEFYAVNSSHPEEEFDPERSSRKIDVDVFIDDRNVGGYLEWGEIMEWLAPDEENYLDRYYRKKDSFLHRFFSYFRSN